MIFLCLRNKYIITVVIFISWILFFDKNDLISRYESRYRLKKLQQEKEYFQSEIQADKKALDELMSNSRTLEKFARERYLMKKANEEIILIHEEIPG